MSVRLEQLLANATPGPWATGHGSFGGADVHSEPDSMLVAKAWPGVGVLEGDNAALIALVPDGFRLLLDMGDAVALSRGYIPSSEQFGALDINALLSRLDALGKDTA